VVGEGVGDGFEGGLVAGDDRDVEGGVEAGEGVPSRARKSVQEATSPRVAMFVPERVDSMLLVSR
jgi:hypothetical protein